MNSSPRWKNDTDMYIWMMFEGCNLSERHSGCSFVPTAWNMNSFSIQRSRDIGQNAVAIFLLLEIYRRYCLRSGDRRGNTGASVQKYCASVEKIIRFFNYGMPYVDGNFHSGTMVSSSISSFFFFLSSSSAREFLLRLDVCSRDVLSNWWESSRNYLFMRTGDLGFYGSTTWSRQHLSWSNVFNS